MARPTKYDPDYCDHVIAIMGEGLSLTAFAGEIGVARSTINEWMGANPAFSEAVRVGQAKRVTYLERTMLDGDAGPKITARIFALKNADPEEWRDKREVEHSGSVEVASKQQRDAAVAAGTRADQ
jgi:hypothetical protein